jgi:hypothetical protein
MAAELELNVAHRNGILDGTRAIFAGGKLQVRSGARPGADATATGTLLVEIDPLPSPAFAAASSGSIAKAGVWSGTVLATGEPGHFRLLNAAGTQIREGNAAETPGDGETMILSGLVDGDLVEGGTLTIDSYTIAQAAGDTV